MMRNVALQLMRMVLMSAGAVLLDYALARSNVRYGPYPEAGWTVAFLAVQVGLCAIWAAIGRDHWLARLAVFLVSFAGVWIFLNQWQTQARGELLSGYETQGVVVIGVLLLMRLLHFRLVRSNRGELKTGLQEPQTLVPRYSIRDIMIGTTLICVFLAVLKRLEVMDVKQDAPLIAYFIGFFISALTLISVASILAFRQVALPAVLTCGGSFLLGWGVAKILRYDYRASMLAVGMATSLQMAVLIPLRLAGYRLMRSAGDAAPLKS